MPIPKENCNHYNFVIRGNDPARPMPQVFCPDCESLIPFHKAMTNFLNEIREKIRRLEDADT